METQLISDAKQKCKEQILEAICVLQEAIGNTCYINEIEIDFYKMNNENNIPICFQTDINISIEVK